MGCYCLATRFLSLIFSVSKSTRLRRTYVTSFTISFKDFISVVFLFSLSLQPNIRCGAKKFKPNCYLIRIHEKLEFTSVNFSFHVCRFISDYQAIKGKKIYDAIFIIKFNLFTLYHFRFDLFIKFRICVRSDVKFEFYVWRKVV